MKTFHLHKFLCTGSLQNVALHLRRASGSALLISLMTLAILTLIGTYAITTSNIEIQATGNDRRHKVAFYVAELGIISAETAVEMLPSRQALDENNVTGHYGKDSIPPWYDLAWDTSDSVAVTSLPTGLRDMGSPPNYVVGERQFERDSLTLGIGVPRGIYRFRVLAQGNDASGTAQMVLQSIYAKRFD